jgi:3-hydroxyisobutyrate dehydrogenase-like beta-hydroxyacid dehydrogenase
VAVVVGVISPGAMGSALGAACAAAGSRVVVTLEGRSARSARLAGEASLELLDSLDDVVAASDVLLSVVPPEAAPSVAKAIAAAAVRTGRKPLVADLNAVSPMTAQGMNDVLAADGLDLVDGSISGPPPRRPGTTRVYLSGRRAAELAELGAPMLDVRVVGSEIGTASAVKMCTASLYKGTVALLAEALLTARSHDVVDVVLDDLRDSYPQLVDQAPSVLARAAAKAARYVGEMDQIADTQAAAGLPRSLFAGMREVYAQLAASPLAERDPEDLPDASLTAVLDGLLPRR